MRLFCYTLIALLFFSLLSGCFGSSAPEPLISPALGIFPASDSHNSQPLPTFSADSASPPPAPGFPETFISPIDAALLRLNSTLTSAQLNSDLFAYICAYLWYEEYRHFFVQFATLSDISPFAYIETRNSAFLQSAALAQLSSDSALPIHQFRYLSDIFREKALSLYAALRNNGIDAEFAYSEEDAYVFFYTADYLNSDLSAPQKNDFDYYRGGICLIGAIFDEEIYLYSAYPFGMILSLKGEQRLFPWSDGGLTPRAILPQLQLSDLNNDGIAELLVILLTGSGTGVTIEELHIVEFDGKDAPSFIDTVINANNCYEKYAHSFALRYEPLSKSAYLWFDGTESMVDLSAAVADHVTDIYGIDHESIIKFNIVDGVPRLTVELAVFIVESATPAFYLIYSSDIRYIRPYDFELHNSLLYHS